MKKIVINNCFGGFSLSIKAMLRWGELNGLKLFPYESNWDGELKPATNNSYAPLIYYEQQNLTNSKDSDKAYYDYEMKRDDPTLIQTVEELGKEANGIYASLKIVEIPDNIDWEIENYDGNETIVEIVEKRRSWR